MKMIEKKITFGIIVGTRGFFNPALAADGRTQILAKLDSLGFSYIIPPREATANGAIETYKDAALCAELFRKNREEIDGIIVLLPNFGDELGVVNTISLSELRVPVLVQAANDENDKVGVFERRDSFCGKLSVCNNLYQYNIPFTDTTYHTTDIDGSDFESDLHRFAAVCRVVKGLKTARIGAIGTRPAAFQTVRFSEKLLQKTGITVVPVDLSEIIAAAENLDTSSSSVKAKLSDIHGYGTIPDVIPSENISRQARLSVAIEQFMDENDLDASAVQCWDSIQKNYGCATCLSMSMMGENKRPSACEMDVAGAVSMYTLLLASGNAPGFLDWNNNYDYNADKCVATHCSNYPKSFMGSTIEISNLDILGETIGKDKCFGAIKGKVAPGPMTYFRVSTDDSRGIIKAYLGEGEFTDDPYAMDGGIAVCKVPGLNNLMKYITQNGFEHHVSMVRGHVSMIVREAIEKYLDWDLYSHNV